MRTSGASEADGAAARVAAASRSARACASSSPRRSWSGPWPSTSSPRSSRARCRCFRSSPTRCCAWAPRAMAGSSRPRPSGAVLGSLYTSLRPLPRRQGRVLSGPVAAYGVATVVYGLSRSYRLTFLALAATGLADLVSTVIRQTLRQLITPDALRGPHDLGQHDLLHGRAAARRDGGRPRGLALRLGRRRASPSRSSPAALVTSGRGRGRRGHPARAPLRASRGAARRAVRILAPAAGRLRT